MKIQNACASSSGSRSKIPILRGFATVCSTINIKIQRILKKERMIKMHEIEVTNENFEETVLKSDRTVLLDFWAPWCNPCRMLGPVVSEIASEHADTLTVGKVNVDEQPELSAKFGVTAIPMIAVIKDGKTVNTVVGFHTKQQLEELLG